MYRLELNAGVPIKLIKNEYIKHLKIGFTSHNGDAYVSNQDIENFLSNTDLVKSIDMEIEWAKRLRNSEKIDINYDDKKGVI